MLNSSRRISKIAQFRQKFEPEGLAKEREGYNV